MKFLYVGDLHQDELEPINRIDDFNQTRKNKIEEIINIAKNNSVQAILHGGDFFNRPKMSNEFVTSIIETWNEKLIPIDIQDLTFKFQAGIIKEEEYIKLLHQYKIGNIPFITIIGNHDLIGENMESYPKTSLNVLETSGFLHVVDKEHPIFFQDEDITVGITGYHYNRELDKSTDKEGYCVKKAICNGKQVDFHIHLTHGMLTNQSYGQKFAHTVIIDVANKTEADLTLNGHDHIGFPITEMNGKLFANPGSPFRLSAEKKEMTRMPKVLLINIDKTGIKLEEIYLRCAKKGDEVLSTEGKKNRQSKQTKMAQIQTLINQSSLNKGLRIADIIDNIGSAENIDSEILKDVQQKIINSMSLLQPAFSPSGEYYITRLELENFLSHQKSSFDFVEGLNILAGESRSGKSAVLRALREVLTCYLTQPRKAIFFGASYFAITVYTSNGYIVTRRVERDEKKGFNGYIVYNPVTGQTSKYNTKSVPLIQEILGYKKIPLTDKKQIDINSVIQGDGWFFTGNNTTAPDRARLLGVVYGTHFADAANKEINTDIKKKNAQLALVKKEQNRLEILKKNYNYLPNLKQKLDNADILINNLEEKEKQLNIIKQYYQQILSIQKEKEKLQKVFQIFSINLKPYLQILQEQKRQLDLMNQIYKAINVIITQGRQLRFVSNSLSNIAHLNSQVTLLKVQEKKLKEDKEKYEKCFNLVKVMGKIDLEKKQLTYVNHSLLTLTQARNQWDIINDFAKALKQKKEDTKRVLEIKEKMSYLKKNFTQLQTVQNQLKILPRIDIVKDLQKKNEFIVKAKKIETQIISISKEGKEQRTLYNEMKEKNLANIELYKTILESIGECPVCHSDIDSNIITKLIQSHLEKIESIK